MERGGNEVTSSMAQDRDHGNAWVFRQYGAYGMTAESFTREEIFLVILAGIDLIWGVFTGLCLSA